MTSDPVGMPVYVWDASSLHHVAKAGRLDLLGMYVGSVDHSPSVHKLTDVVADELARYGLDIPDWCSVVTLESIDDVVAFGQWTTLLADGDRGLGEASVAAVVQTSGGTAVVDDGPAKAVITRNGLPAHGSVWMLCQAVKARRVDVASVSALCDASIGTGARLPFGRFGFRQWALREGLLSTDDL